METLHLVLIGGAAALLFGKKKPSEPEPTTPRVSTDSGLTLPALQQVQADVKKFECPTDKAGFATLKTSDPVNYKKCREGTHLVATSTVVGPKLTTVPDQSTGCIPVRQVTQEMARRMVANLGWKETGSIMLGYGSLCPPGTSPTIIAASVVKSV